MKVNSHHRPKTKPLYKILSVAGASLFILFFARDIVSMAMGTASAPLFSLRHYIETSSDTVPRYIRNSLELQNEIKALKLEIASQQGIKSVLTAVKKENEELRLLLGDTPRESILAGVIARPPFTPYDTLIVDRGENDGVVVGAPVFYGAGMALGYTRAVYPNQSLITLFSSPDVEITVYAYGPNIFTNGYGEGNGVVRLSIPQGVSVNKGDVVVLPSMSRGVLGTITFVESTPTEPEQRAYITTSVPLQSIHFVQIDKHPLTPVDFSDALKNVREDEKKLLKLSIPTSFDYKLSSTTGSSSVTQ